MSTAVATTAPEPSDRHAKRGDGINLTRGEIVSGISGYAQDVQADLLWLHGYAVDELGSSRTRLVEALRLDWTTLWRVWSGKYEASPDKVIERVRRFRRKAESAHRRRFIETVVTRRIMSVLDAARDRGIMAMLSGPTGRSKTWTLDEWRHANNHGRAIYVYAPATGGFRSFLETLAESLSISRHASNYDIMRSVFNALDERNVLIVDEVAHLYPTGRASSLQALEFIRELHDRTGCGIVLCATDGFEAILQGGKWAQWFDQLLGRIELHLRIPRTFSRQEVAELLGGYIDDPDPDLVAAARQIANQSRRGCRDLFRHLDRAAQVAAECGRPLSAEILRQTVAASAQLLTFEKE